MTDTTSFFIFTTCILFMTNCVFVALMIYYHGKAHKPDPPPPYKLTKEEMDLDTEYIRAHDSIRPNGSLAHIQSDMRLFAELWQNFPPVERYRIVDSWRRAIEAELPKVPEVHEDLNTVQIGAMNFHRRNV